MDNEPAMLAELQSARCTVCGPAEGLSTIPGGLPVYAEKWRKDYTAFDASLLRWHAIVSRNDKCMECSDWRDVWESHYEDNWWRKRNEKIGQISEEKRIEHEVKARKLLEWVVQEFQKWGNDKIDDIYVVVVKKT